MKSTTNQTKAYIFALIAVLFWSTMSSVFKITLRFIAFDELLLWSSLSGFFILMIINQVSSKRIVFSSLKGKEVLSSALMGFFNPFLYYFVLFKAYELLEAQIAGTLNYIWPIALVLMSIVFLKQKIGLLSIVAVFVSFAGIVLISTKGRFSGYGDISLFGVFLAVFSAFIWAYYWILNMKDKREESGKIVLNLFFGCLYILLYLIITSRPICLPSTEAFMGILYIGAFEMSFTFVIWLMALNNSENTAKVSNLIFLSPFIGLFFIYFFVGEEIHITTIAGLIAIIGGIILQQFSGEKKKESI